MLTRLCLGFAVLITVPALAQVDTDTDAQAASAQGARMSVPPPASGQSYVGTVGAEERSNYVRGSLGFTGGYVDNLYAGTLAAPVSDSIFTITPLIALDALNSRVHWTLSYGPGFTFYFPTSVLNQTDQNANFTMAYRVTPHATVQIGDTLQKSSTAFNLPYGGEGSGVAGSTQAIVPGIVAPFGERLTNLAHVEFSEQFALNDMAGGGGLLALTDYPDPSQTPGLYDSHGEGGSAFYTHRFNERQYLGVTYQYSRDTEKPQDIYSKTVTNTVLPFYTFFLRRNLSFSLEAGPQQFVVSQTALPTTRAWGVAAMGSAGWQGLHTALSINYSRTVTGGGGLVGGFQTNSAAASARWQFARNWTAGVAANYSTANNLSPLIFSSPGGHTIGGSANLQYRIGQNISANFQYDRLHQRYDGVTTISASPDSNRETASIAWHFSRPWGR